MALEGEDGTKEWVSTASEADDFAVDSIFLVGKGERGERGTDKVIKWHGCSG
jgi:hypothetical protein